MRQWSVVIPVVFEKHLLGPTDREPFTRWFEAPSNGCECTGSDFLRVLGGGQGVRFSGTPCVRSVCGSMCMKTLIMGADRRGRLGYPS